MNKLAIVVPAYKSKYFREALQSISNQSCKDFTLYIGDDASPDDLKSIVDLNSRNISIVYKRFENNLGEKDLASHWERCIDLARNEEWIWLFSDDDIMSDNCVEGFYETLTKYDKESVTDKVLRFNLSITDADLNMFKKYITPPDFSVEYFLESYFVNHRLRNKAVEFIFPKENYIKKGKFVKFPLAWGSDTATILKLGRTAGFLTIDKGDVFWRDSGYNISSTGNNKVDSQKPFATNLFFAWVIDFISVYKGSKFYEKLIYRILYSLPALPSMINVKEINAGKDLLYYKILIWIVYIKIKRFFRVRKITILINRFGLSH